MSCPLADYVPQRIALIKPSALGDIVHALPVLTALRRRYPHAHITWAVNRGYEPLLRGHPDLDATLPFDRGASRSSLMRAVCTYAAFFRELRRQQFDLVIDLQGLLRSGLMTAATGAARRVGSASAREGAAWFYTDRVPSPPVRTMHAVDRNWLLAQALGATGPKEFRLHVPAEAQTWASEVLAGLPRPWLVLGVGARWLTKRWPPEHFAALTGRAHAQFGGTVLFIGGKDETSLAATTAALLACPKLDLTGSTTLPQLAALLQRADVVLANDTGPLHLAAALGRPVVAPYTCTRVALNGPYDTPEHAVETRVACAGSYLKQCARLDCLRELTPDRLWPVLFEVLRRWHGSSRSA